MANAGSYIGGDHASDTGESYARFFERLAPHLNGLEVEYYMQSSDEAHLRSSGTAAWYHHWDGWMDVQTRTQNAGADFFGLMYGTISNHAYMRYGKASFLLGWDGSGGAFIYHPQSDPWHAEWTMDIGQPAGARYRVGVGWRRDYSGGTVILNPDVSQSQTFALGGTYTRPDGTSVTSVTLSATSALVLKSQGGPPPPPPPPPPPGPPANTALPVITGTAQQDATLSASTGTWTNSPSGYAYAWSRCDTAGANCSTVGGATAATYTVAAADVGKRMRVTVTATNAGGSASATSNATGVVSPLPPPPPPPPPNAVPPSSLSLPVITGTAQQGSTLTASPGNWANNPTGFTYQWLRCEPGGDSCATIPGSTGTQHTVGTYAVGKTLRVTVRASNAAGASSATSNPTAVITEAPPAHKPRISVRPTVSGMAQQGQELTATRGTWTNSPRYYSFQWRRCNASGGNCVNIDGATTNEYAPTAADVGFALRVVVAASNEAGVTFARTDVTSIIAPSPAVYDGERDG
jgi:hypothetical protein